MNTASTLPAPHLVFEEIRDIRLVQITDCHLFADAETLMRGWNTRDSFERVFGSVLKDEPCADLLLATGDLSQDETPESYRYLATRLDEMGVPVAWLPGNHDDRAAMADAFCGDSILPARHLLIGNWHILLLDSTIPGEVQGRVDESQIEFMHVALAQHADRHALVCLHHPAIPPGSRWLDQKSLLEAESFCAEIVRHENVRGVVWGHVHQEGYFERNGIDWMSTPSTCTQFKPHAEEFMLDSLPPGYRRIILRPDGGIESAVVRVAFP